MPLSPLEQKFVAVGAVTLLTFVNILGVRKAAAVQTLFSVAKLAGLAIIMGAALFSRHIVPVQATHALPMPHTTASSFGVAMIGVLWACEGWHMLSFAAGEVKNPSRVLPRSYLVGTLVVIAVYLGANLAYLHVLPLPALAEHQRVAAKTMEVLAGPRGATFVAALILCSIFGAINGTVLGGPRAYFAMARDGVLFPSMGRVHPRYATPAVALLIQGGWSILLALTGTYKQLYTYVIFTGWLFYAAATFAVVILRRKRPDMERPYRVWGYPLVPIVFSAAALTIVVNALLRSPKEAGIGLILVLAGVPVFLFWGRKARSRKLETGK
jgi:APA family basic amino acid/polyamine antiporter